jgi:hypothetical protein
MRMLLSAALLAGGCGADVVPLDEARSCSVEVPTDQFTEDQAAPRQTWTRTFPAFETECVISQARVTFRELSVLHVASSYCNRCDRAVSLDFIYGVGGPDQTSPSVESGLDVAGSSSLTLVDSSGREYTPRCGGECSFGPGFVPNYDYFAGRVDLPPGASVSVSRGATIHVLRGSDRGGRAPIRGAPAPLDFQSGLSARFYWPRFKDDPTGAQTLQEAAAPLAHCRAQGLSLEEWYDARVKVVDAGLLGDRDRLYHRQDAGPLNLPPHVQAWLDAQPPLEPCDW